MLRHTHIQNPWDLPGIASMDKFHNFIVENKIWEKNTKLKILNFEKTTSFSNLQN